MLWVLFGAEVPHGWDATLTPVVLWLERGDTGGMKMKMKITSTWYTWIAGAFSGSTGRTVK